MGSRRSLGPLHLQLCLQDGAREDAWQHDSVDSMKSVASENGRMKEYEQLSLERSILAAS